MQTTNRTDVYQRITAHIVAELEGGTRPWLKPWQVNSAAGPVSRPLRSDGTPYRGINILLLWSEAVEQGFYSPVWMTYNRAKALGAQVRKGEHGTLVVYADSIAKTETDAQGEEKTRQIYFMKGYTVFNADQIDNLPEKYQPVPAEYLPTSEHVELALARLQKIGADIRHGGSKAFYSPMGDFIQLPPLNAFRDGESYAATTAHELAHWTGHASRLDRDFFAKNLQYGTEEYAFEELVAELTSAFLCSELAITPEVREDHAAYLSHWLDILKNDKRAIFAAAAQAQRAADYLLDR
jgi:antirestriction protein ArdC